jgi:hypothetical protein
MFGKVNVFDVVGPTFVELTVTELKTPSGFVLPITAKLLFSTYRSPTVVTPPMYTAQPDPPLRWRRSGGWDGHDRRCGDGRCERRRLGRR